MLAGIATALLAGRMVVRGVVQRSYHADDLCTALAWLLMIVALIIATVSNPLSYQFTSILVGEAPAPSPEEWEDMAIRLRRWSVSAQTLFWTSIYLVKLSFMFLYRLITASVYEHRRVWLVAMVYIAMSYGICLIGVFGQCGDARNLFSYGELASNPPSTVVVP